jgi:hypothetical protein
MKFEWLRDDRKGNHLLCLAEQRSLFFRGTLSSERGGKRLWQPFPEGELQEVSADLKKAQRQCEEIVSSVASADIGI